MLGACGGGQEGGSGAADSAPLDEGLLEFVRCMRRQGIQLADPKITGEDKVEIRPAQGAPIASRADFDAATEACEREGYSRFGTTKPKRTVEPDREDNAIEFARCARREGVDLPDPRFEDGAITNWSPAALGIDLDDPDVVAIGETCARESGFDPWKEL